MTCHYCGEKADKGYLVHVQRGSKSRTYHIDCFTEVANPAPSVAEAAERVLEDLGEKS